MTVHPTLNEDKYPIYFSVGDFRRTNAAGNTHFCLKCGGERGFRLDENGKPTNCMSAFAFLHNGDEPGILKPRMTFLEAQDNAELAPYLQKRPDRIKPGMPDYEAWLGEVAIFNWSLEFQALAERYGYKTYRRNPMKHHGPDHEPFVISGFQESDSIGKWVEELVLPTDAPYYLSLRY